ncbi:MAG: hypothetical protein EHM67_17590 [Hyphomicrobiaceae bacterium]|nr:MAG: hypothetical protein EHM67_17590 [Hyphomicrobiaceae bacterium]
MACADAGYATSTALQTFEPEHIRNGGHVFVRRKKPGNIQSGYAFANGALETSFQHKSKLAAIVEAARTADRPQLARETHLIFGLGRSRLYYVEWDPCTYVMHARKTLRNPARLFGGQSANSASLIIKVMR